MLPAIYFFDFVVALHVMCVVIAFGVTFAYPLVIPWLRSTHPTAMPTLHDVQGRLGKRLITPFATLLLLSGIYLASDRDLWDQTWVTVPLVILIVILGLGGAFFSPRERRLAKLADRDLGPQRDGALSDEYGALLKSTLVVNVIASLLVLVAIFFMVAKPFAG